MATSYSTLLGLALPVQGELSGTWGDTVNNYITNYLDAAVAGTQTISTDANVTLTKTTGSALTTTSSQYAILLCTGARTAERTITAPAASKLYAVVNATTGGFGVKLVGAGPTTGVTIPNGMRAFVVWNGSDFDIVSMVNAAGVVTATSGGTGQSSYAVGDILYASTTSALSRLADVATGNALISGGVGVAPSYGKIGLTTHVSGTLAAGNGGTGQSSYAVGDILYADTASSVNKLADVATGNALISGGVGVAPSYGKIGLTTHISGTLPVGNGGTGVATLTGLAYGNGTGAFTAATAAQVVGVISTTAVTNATNATNLTGSGTVSATATGGAGLTPTNATNATNATNVAIAADTTTAATFYIPYASATTGNVALKGTRLTVTPSTGDFAAAGNVTAYSDERLKTNWQEFGADILSQLAKVKVGVYDRTDTGATQVGVSAQSLQAVLPNAVNTGEDGMLSVAYGNAALSMCVMLAREVEALKAELKALKGA